MPRYPYNIYLKTADGWIAVGALLYGAFRFISGFAFAGDGGRLASGSDGAAVGLLFMCAAVGYFAWIDWRANESWKAKMVLRVSLGAFAVTLVTYLFRAFVS